LGYDGAEGLGWKCAVIDLLSNHLYIFITLWLESRLRVRGLRRNKMHLIDTGTYFSYYMIWNILSLAVQIGWTLMNFGDLPCTCIIHKHVKSWNIRIYYDNTNGGLVSRTITCAFAHSSHTALGNANARMRLTKNEIKIVWLHIHTVSYYYADDDGRRVAYTQDSDEDSAPRAESGGSHNDRGRGEEEEEEKEEEVVGVEGTLVLITFTRTIFSTCALPG